MKIGVNSLMILCAFFVGDIQSETIPIKYILTSSTIGGGRGCNKFVPVLVGNGTKIAPTGDIFDQPPGQM